MNQYFEMCYFNQIVFSILIKLLSYKNVYILLMYVTVGENHTVGGPRVTMVPQLTAQ